MTLTTEQLLESRVQLGWAGKAWGGDPKTLDNVLVVGNWLEDPDKRYTLFFKFNKVKGCIDGDNFVAWSCMGSHLQDIGNIDFRFAIWEQTGVKLDSDNFSYPKEA